jgi:hypothetical protein
LFSEPTLARLQAYAKRHDIALSEALRRVLDNALGLSSETTADLDFQATPDAAGRYRKLFQQLARANAQIFQLNVKISELEDRMGDQAPAVQPPREREDDINTMLQRVLCGTADLITRSDSEWASVYGQQIVDDILTDPESAVGRLAALLWLTALFLGELSNLAAAKQLSPDAAQDLVRQIGHIAVLGDRCAATLDEARKLQAESHP